MRGVALLLTLLTGFTGLVYEVAWQKYLAALLGSHSEATAAVLGIFLGGLSFGYYLFGRVSRRRVERARDRGEAPRLLLVYGVVEASIGLYALAFPLLFSVFRALSLSLPHSSEGLAFAIDLLLTALLIGPPTVLMGGTIPLLTQGLARSLDDATRFHSLVYALNTLGAFAGALCAGFFLVPLLGLRGTLVVMGVINVAAGVVFLLLGKREDALEPGDPGRETPEPRAALSQDDLAPGTRHTLLACTTVALLAGFAMMTLQTAMNRIGALSLGASSFTFSMVVATFVLCIALGSFAVSALPRVRPSHLPLTQWLLVVYLLLLYPALENAPYWAHVARMTFTAHPGSFLPFHFAVFLGLFAVFAIPLALSGAMLPLLFHDLRRESHDLGQIAGRLYSWNTVGSLAGALLGGYALLFWLDLHHTYRLAVAALAACALLLSLRVVATPGGRTLAAGAFALVLIATVTQSPWAPERLSSGLFRTRTPLPQTWNGPEAFFGSGAREFDADALLFYDDDPSATISVLQTAPDSISIVANGKSDGNIPTDNSTTGMLALLPALLAEKAERAFVIGYGTGMTVGELAALESMREVEVAEISPGVVAAAPLFEAFNRHALGSRKTRVLRSDAYRALLRSDGGYDLIVSEPSNPWVTGIEMLYSADFLTAARTRLAPGGVYAQWFHVYETDTRSVRLVLRSYLEAFERVAVWSGGETDLIILGFSDDDHQIDLEALLNRFRQPDFRAQFAAFGISSFPRLLAHEILPLGVVNEMELGDELHTILHPRLSDAAARAFFTGGFARIPVSATREAARVGARSSLVRRFQERAGGSLPDEFRLELLREACLLSKDVCATLFARWSHEDPGSPVLAERLAMARTNARLRDALDPVKLARLALLFRRDGMPTEPARFETAVEVANAFVLYYVHAAPFHAEALHRPWRSCAADPRCAREWDRIEGLGAEPAAMHAAGTRISAR